MRKGTKLAESVSSNEGARLRSTTVIWISFEGTKATYLMSLVFFERIVLDDNPIPQIIRVLKLGINS